MAKPAIIVTVFLLLAIVVLAQVGPIDLNRDGVVDIGDLLLVSQVFGRRQGTDADFNSTADLNSDGRISLWDFVMLVRGMGSASVPLPAFSPPGGTYSNPVLVNISAGAQYQVFYTTDGRDPTLKSPRFTTRINISSATTVKAIAFSRNASHGQVSSASYQVNAPLENAPPSVYAGPDTVALYPANISLTGTVSDDDLPNPPGTTTVLWSKVSGPGTVTFRNPGAVSTTAGFSVPGTYVIRLSASDSILTGQDDLAISYINQSTSWYMSGANPERTSWVPEEVRGGLQVDWYRPIEPYIPYKVQPIAANGLIYVSTSRGLYAFSAANGDITWTYPTSMPLGNAPTVVTVQLGGIPTSVAYVGGYDRKVHAVNALTGQDIPTYSGYEAGAGFETNPLVIADASDSYRPTIYAGNRDGYIYALDAADGSLVWRYKTGGPILFSAAYKDGVIYFASDDAYAYALNSTDGRLVWKSAKLGGAGFHSFWPVIYTEKLTRKDYVIFTGGENYMNLGLTSEEGETFFPDCFTSPSCPWGNLIGTESVAPNNGYWTTGSDLMDISKINTYYEGSGYRRTVFILDRATGTEYTFDSNGNGIQEYAPFTWSGVTYSGNKYPPLVNGIDNIYYQHTVYASSPYIVRGDVVGWEFGTHYASRVASSTVAHAVDEPMAYSSGGKLIYWSLCGDREAGYYDVTVPYGQAGRNYDYMSYNIMQQAPDYRLMYNDGNPAAYNDMNGWQIYSGKNQSKNGVYSNHGTTQSPPIPYNGRVYMLKGNALISWKYPAAASRLPLSAIVPANAGASPLAVGQLNQDLDDEIQKMLDAGHLRPGYHDTGLVNDFGEGNFPTYDQANFRELGEIFDYFQNPSDTVVTMLQALPYLPPAKQEQVKDYVRDNYGPGAPYDFTQIVHIGWNTGTPREAFDIPQDLWASRYSSFAKRTTPICGDCGYWQAYPPFSFYAAWKYAQVFGNATAVFNQVRGKLEAPPSDAYLVSKPYMLNLYASGYMGYLELQKLAGYPENASVRSTYNRLLDLRVRNFSKDTPYWDDRSLGAGDVSGNYLRTLSIARNFMFMTPELAAYMRQNMYPQAKQAVAEYEYVAPYWFVSKYDNTIGEGTLQTLYDYPAIFQAKAYILGEPRQNLTQYIDVPAFEKGDLFHIQNIVAALAANTS